MSNLKAIKTRIASVKSTQKITKAMKMISTVRLKKARSDLASIREYTQEISHQIANVYTNLLPEELENAMGNKILRSLLANASSGPTLLVVISSDKGLCGSLNSGLFKVLESKITENCMIYTIGKKAYEYYAHRHKSKLVNQKVAFSSNIDADIHMQILQIYTQLSAQDITIIHPLFISSIKHSIETSLIFPFKIEKSNELYNFDVPKNEILETLIIEYFSAIVKSQLLESLASEHSSRMMAMEGATKNAEETIKSLSLLYNRTRQAHITREISEIVAGSM